MDPQQFRHWAGLNDDALMLVTPDGRIVELNGIAAALLRRPRRELVGMAMDDVLCGPGERLRDFLRMCSRSRQFIPGSVTVQVAGQDVHLRCDGVSSSSEVRADPLLILRLREKLAADRGFELLNRAQHIERLANEIEQRKTALAALYNERELFRVTLGSIGDGVIATDARGRITFMNACAEALTGWTQAEAGAAPLTEVFHIVNETSRLPVDNPLERALSAGTVVGLANHTVLIDRNGQERAIDDSAAPIRSQEGRVLGAVLVFRDVSQKRAAELALTSSHDALEARVVQRTAELERTNRALLHHQEKLVAANAELEQFAYIAAHDLQEPIRMIVSYLQLVERRARPSLDEQTRGFFDTAAASAMRMQEMVRSVLEFSTIGKDERQADAVDLEGIVGHALEHLRPMIEQTGAVVEHAGLPTVPGTKTQIGRLVQNLLSNALKFRSSEPPRIRISASRRGRFWEISVADNGIGIRREEAGRLFQLFQRLHPAEQYPGVGIGLASCRKIVEQHGGTIWFETAEDGSGTVFRFTLPAVRMGQ